MVDFQFAGDSANQCGAEIVHPHCHQPLDDEYGGSHQRIGLMSNGGNVLDRFGVFTVEVVINRGILQQTSQLALPVQMGKQNGENRTAKADTPIGARPLSCLPRDADRNGIGADNAGEDRPIRGGKLDIRIESIVERALRGIETDAAHGLFQKRCGVLFRGNIFRGIKLFDDRRFTARVGGVDLGVESALRFITPPQPKPKQNCHQQQRGKAEPLQPPEARWMRFEKFRGGGDGRLHGQEYKGWSCELSEFFDLIWQTASNGGFGLQSTPTEKELRTHVDSIRVGTIRFRCCAR